MWWGWKAFFMHASHTHSGTITYLHASHAYTHTMTAHTCMHHPHPSTHHHHHTQLLKQHQHEWGAEEVATAASTWRWQELKQRAIDGCFSTADMGCLSLHEYSDWEGAHITIPLGFQVGCWVGCVLLMGGAVLVCACMCVVICTDMYRY